MSQHRAWLFDFDGTLYRARPVQLLMGMELMLFGWKALAVLRRFRKSHEELRRGELGNHPAVALGQSPFEQQLAVTAADLDLAPALVRQAVEHWMMHRPQRWIRLFLRQSLLREMRAFKASGGKIALVSDYPLQVKMRALGASDVFDAVVASGEPGGPIRLKPAPDGYLAAATLLGVAPSECLVLGDRLDADGKAAAAAGMAFRHIR